MNDPGLDRIPCYCDARCYHGKMEMKFGLLPTVEDWRSGEASLSRLCLSISVKNSYSN